MWDHEPKESSYLNAKPAFGKIEFHGISMKGIESAPYVMDILFKSGTFDQHIVYIDFHGMINLIVENFVD